MTTFSYWTFLWFILYLLRIIPYSPKFAFIVEIIIVSIMAFIPMNLYKLTKFIIINIIIKGIPLWIIRNSMITKTDVLFSIFIFLCYLLWLYVNDKTIVDIYTMIYSHYVNGDTNQLIGGKIYDEIYFKLNGSPTSDFAP
jgi:hypothetical protein